MSSESSSPEPPEFRCAKTLRNNGHLVKNASSKYGKERHPEVVRDTEINTRERFEARRTISSQALLVRSRDRKQVNQELRCSTPGICRQEKVPFAGNPSELPCREARFVAGQPNSRSQHAG